MNIIITGASKGIGRALALEFSKRRVGNLYLISRSSQALREVCQCCQDINPENEFFAIPFNLDEVIYGKQLPFRITSYNVCYTKLLRFKRFINQNPGIIYQDIYARNNFV